MKKVFVLSLVMLSALAGVGFAQFTQTSLQYLAACDFGGPVFPSSGSLFIDKNNAFAASAQGQLVILASKTKAGVCPGPVSSIDLSTQQLNAVKGDGQHVYVADAAGKFYVLNEASPFSEVREFAYSYSVPSLTIAEKNLFFSMGQGQLGVTANGNVLLSQVNPSDIGIEATKSGKQEMVYGGSNFTSGFTTVYNAETGEEIGNLPNPEADQQVAIYTAGNITALLTPGCCGNGVALYDNTTLQELSFIDSLYADSIVIADGGRAALIGTEDGKIYLYNIANPEKPVFKMYVDLVQELGGTTGSVEVRAIGIAPDGKTVIALSTGGLNQTTKTLFFLHLIG